MAVWANSSIPQLILWGTILLLMLAVGYFVVRRWRDSAVNDNQDDPQMLAKFQELKVQGAINDKEYRTIQSLLNTPAQSKEKQTHHNT